MGLQTSPQGEAFLERHEGVVLKAYRDPVGIWTIGPGLTKASGVVVPKAGMTITRQQSRNLTRKALRRNYEPAVNAAMPGAVQREFDGGISFQWNTGAIGRASWLQRWKAGDWRGVQIRLAAWRKAGGRVFAGLERRRAEEFELMRYGNYGPLPDVAKAAKIKAAIVIPLDKHELAAMYAGFAKLGYRITAPVDQSVVEVRRFQREHDLNVDGLIGRATLSALQRRLDTPKKVAAPATATGGGTAAVTAPDAVIPAEVAYALLAVCLIWLAWTAWQYRDTIAVKVQNRLPSLARKLRSL